MTDIQKLLSTYQSGYAPGEKRSNKYNHRKKTEAKIMNRMRVLSQIVNELPDSLRVNKDQVMLCKNLIRTFVNFKYLHRQVSEETIILAFLFCSSYHLLKNKEINLTVKCSYQYYSFIFYLSK